MKSLIMLEEALLAENVQGVSAYMEELDRKTANERMIQAGEQY